MRTAQSMSKLSSFTACTIAGTLLVVSVVLPATSAFAQNLVKDGTFLSTTNGAGQLGYNTNLNNWTVDNGSYNFLFTSSTIDKPGTKGQYADLYMWGPNNGVNNGLTGIAPAGGNIIGADGGFNVGAISQTITGLTVNALYNVQFYWAGAQQHGYDQGTTEQWQVTFGSQRKDTAVVSNVEHGFTGWRQENFSFTATSTSQVLSFLAAGTPNSQPPFSLLSGVSVTAAPEPGTLSLLVAGGAVGLLVVCKRKRS